MDDLMARYWTQQWVLLLDRWIVLAGLLTGLFLLGLACWAVVEMWRHG